MVSAAGTTSRRKTENKRERERRKAYKNDHREKSMDVHSIHCEHIKWENSERVANGKRTTHMKIVTRVKNFLGQAPTRDNSKQTTHHITDTCIYRTRSSSTRSPSRTCAKASSDSTLCRFVCAWFVFFFYCWHCYCCCCPQALT